MPMSIEPFSILLLIGVSENPDFFLCSTSPLSGQGSTGEEGKPGSRKGESDAGQTFFLSESVQGNTRIGV